MIINNFRKYIEGKDLTKIGLNNLAFPSQNCLTHKGKVYSRRGISFFGAEGTLDKKIHSAFNWKDSKSGKELPLRSYSQTLQVYLENFKTGAGWVDLFTGIDINAVRVEFATWVDGNTPIIKKRLFFVDGSDKIYQWNGGVAVIDSIVGNNVTIKGIKTAQQLGFDDGSITQQTVIINGTEYTYSGTVTTTTITLDSAPAGTNGDIIMVKPLTHSATLTAFEKDHVYNYKNHLVVANLTSNEKFYSDTVIYSMATGLDFTTPAPASRNATSPMYFNLDGNITAMIERKGVLWVSTVDDWFKITKLYAKNGFDEWATVEKIESAVKMGALPFAVSSHKTDMIFIAQDKTIQSVSDIEILQADQMKLISDDIEDTLLRLDLTDCRIYYNGRYMYVTIPAESNLLMLDVVEGYWQPPQTIPITRFSIINGVKIGHSNNRNESFKLFDGLNDLGADIQTIIALGYQGYEGKIGELSYKWFTTLGISGRINKETKVNVDVYYETDGAKSQNGFTIDGSKIKTYDISIDESWGTHPFATISFAGGDTPQTSLKRFFLFDKNDAISFFEWQPVFTVTGENQEFQLLALSADIEKSERAIGNDLFTSK